MFVRKVHSRNRYFGRTHFERCFADGGDGGGSGGGDGDGGDDDAAKGKSDAAKGDDLAAEAEKWKANSRKNEERAKANADAAKERDALKAKLDEIEKANMSELEKAQKEAADAVKRAEEAEKGKSAAELSVLKTRVASAKGLPAELADRLVGDDEEAITADAEKLAETLKQGDKWPDMGQGESGKKGKYDGIAASFAAGLGLASEEKK